METLNLIEICATQFCYSIRLMSSQSLKMNYVLFIIIIDIVLNVLA